MNRFVRGMVCVALGARGVTEIRYHNPWWGWTLVVISVAMLIGDVVNERD